MSTILTIVKRIAGDTFFLASRIDPTNPLVRVTTALQYIEESVAPFSLRIPGMWCIFVEPIRVPLWVVVSNDRVITVEHVHKGVELVNTLTGSDYIWKP